MKADLNENGVMTLRPETPTEAYALKHWTEAAWLVREDPTRIEGGHWRGSMLIVDTTVPNATKLTGRGTGPND